MVRARDSLACILCSLRDLLSLGPNMWNFSPGFVIPHCLTENGKNFRARYRVPQKGSSVLCDPSAGGKPAMSETSGESQKESSTEPCSHVFKPESEIEDPSFEWQKGHKLANEVMNAFLRHFVLLGEFERAWQIGHQDPSTFGSVHPKSWVCLMSRTDCFNTLGPPTSHTTVKRLREAEGRSWDKPASKELIAAIEQLESTLGIEWIGANDGHRTVFSHVNEQFLGLRGQEADYLAELKFEAIRELREAKEKQQQARQATKLRRYAEKQRLLLELSKIDAVLQTISIAKPQGTSRRQRPRYATSWVEPGHETEGVL